MSATQQISGYRIAVSSLLGYNRSSTTVISRVSFEIFARKAKVFPINQQKSHRICSTAGDAEAFNPADVHECSADCKGPVEKNGSQPARAFTSKELLKRLRRYGVSGVLSYGILNTIYYLTAFLLVWFYVAPAPGRMGYAAAVERFLKIMAMIWAGSQVTKLIRAGGALALAPFVDTGLAWFTVKFKFESQGKAVMAIVGFCFGLALMLFFVVTLLSA